MKIGRKNWTEVEKFDVSEIAEILHAGGSQCRDQFGPRIVKIGPNQPMKVMFFRF